MNIKTILFGSALLVSQSSFGDIAAPHLWWGHKKLAVDVEKCLLKSRGALLENGFTGISADDEYHFLYGMKGQMRAGVQCVAQDDGSFVYFSVAGPDVNLVEQHRNKVAFSIK